MGVDGRGDSHGESVTGPYGEPGGGEVAATPGDDAAPTGPAHHPADDGDAPVQVPGQGGPPAYESEARGAGAGEQGGEPGGSGAGGVPQQRTAGSDAVRRSESAPADAAQADAALLTRMREGDSEAYDELFRRHADAVRRYARTCCRDADTAEDLTGEVFARTLQAVRRGAGPRTAVRAYLLTSVRRVAAAWAKTTRREQLVEDFAVFAQSAARASTARDEDTLDLGADVRAMREADRSLAVEAFRSLPEKYQTVLWHTTVEDAKPKDVAPLLGLSDNATAVLAHRAREKLKQAYLQAHVSHSLTSGGDCARYADRLGAYARGGLRTRAERGLRKHLEACARCRTAALEVTDLNSQIRILVPLAFIGWFGAAGGAKAFGALLAGGGAAAVGGGAGATGGAVGTAGGAAGPGGGAASKGLGTPVKIGIGAGIATAASIALALALVGNTQPQDPRAKPTPPATVPAQQPERPPEPEKPAPPEERPEPPPRPAPKPSAPKPSAPPEITPSGTPEPTPTPPTEPTPTPPPEPEPEPTKPPPPEPPPPANYQVSQLEWAVLDDPEADEPTVRLGRGSWVWQRDHLRIGGSSYDHGVSVRAPSSVFIDLNRECVAYDALAGVDDLSAGDRGVRFAVLGDGETLWQSPVVRRGAAPEAVHVPLSGVRTLRLVVEPDGPAGRAALADWAQSRITCR
ncbi:sigma-70 family RNA polymerase sigma factor [Streptomyces oceani]|uniref:RNA polymerase subunit sigma-24 n=1 Tax=Streptomyces oceani TaxID=1075402 RepID=A0A1E7JXK4_9ACTN|nr:sigma-70 family RNA polymerase sigma factor [Streptomyces oceani]OEU96418.1 RNA polymerase subunit sigma-24 [Streptomyces oceani]